MFKKTITYKGFTGQAYTEDFYFNLSKAEVAEMDIVAGPEGLTGVLTKVGQSLDGKLVMKTFKDLLLGSYGIKSDDGKRFMKSKEISRTFEETDAYSVFFMELITNAGAAADFVNGIMPEDWIAEVKRQEAAGELPASDLMTPSELARARSEAAMQGHKQNPVTTRQQEPTEQYVAPAEPVPATRDITQDAQPVPVPTPSTPSAEDIAKYLRENPQTIAGGAQSALQ